MHRLLTGQEEPDVFVFSNILWDLGRWLFLSEIAEPERYDVVLMIQKPNFSLLAITSSEVLPADCPRN